MNSFLLNLTDRPWKWAFFWLLSLGSIFFLSYFAANDFASQQEQVVSMVFSWERQIPFLAWSIVPYWSIDLLYGLSLFTCKTYRELMTHVKRLISAQFICVACFFLFPLRFTFERPQVDGFFGWCFDVLMGFDKPFNQAPSLHIVLLVILWVQFAKHLRGWPLRFLHIWFSLIGISVLTTYQHHFIDIPTGIWVGWFCIWLFPENQPSILSRFSISKDRNRLKIASIYALAGAALTTLAFAFSHINLFLLWISGSLLLVSVIYFALDETAFGKNPDGSMNLASKWLLYPYLIGAWLNSRIWTRKTSSLSTVSSELMLGRFPSKADLHKNKIHSIIDLTAELTLNCNKAYTNIPMLDLIVPTKIQLTVAVRAIEAALSKGPVLVCCALGYSRSALVCAAWLIFTQRAHSVNEAISQVKYARPMVVLNKKHTLLLQEFSNSLEKAHE